MTMQAISNTVKLAIHRRQTNNILIIAKGWLTSLLTMDSVDGCQEVVNTNPATGTTDTCQRRQASSWI